MKKQLKWWLIPAVILLAVFLGSGLLWPTLKVYLAPKTVLSAALTDTYAELKHRMQHSPLVLLANTVDAANGNTIELDLDKTDDLPGSVHYDMTVQTKWNPRQISARGQVTDGNKMMDLSVYLDGKFAALSSASILGGNFYGLTYDTFPEDIRSNPLLAMMIGESTLIEWEAAVKDLQRFMAQSWEMPTFSEGDLGSILVGILTLKAEVDQEETLVNGVNEKCFVISFETTGADILSGLKYLDAELPVSLAPEEEVEISFWLQDDTVVKIESEAGDRELDFRIGADRLTFQYETGGEVLTVSVDTQQDASQYQETITVVGTETVQVSYNWDLTTGDFTLQTKQKGEEQSVFLNLSAVSNGFCVETADFEALMHLISGTEDSADSPCTMIVTKGSQIVMPSYKNFSEWSLEDLITLLSGVGGLFGLKIG